MTKAQSANDDELIKLARKRFGYDTIAPEQRAAFDALFFSVHQGKKADYSLRGPSDDDISAGNSWDPSRTVQAAWIIWLCNDQDASKLIPAKGIEIQDAKINGELDLSWLKMQFPLKFPSCYFHDSILLVGAHVRDLNLKNAYIGTSSASASLDASFSTVEGNILLTNVQAEEAVSFRNATVTGGSYSLGAKFSSKNYAAIDLSSAKFGAKIFLPYIKTKGSALLSNVETKGDLDCFAASINDIYLS